MFITIVIHMLLADVHFICLAEPCHMHAQCCPHLWLWTGAQLLPHV
jgi:hypothetical protein